MTHDEFKHMVDRDAVKVRFRMAARLLLFYHYPSLQERVYTPRYLIMRISAHAAQVFSLLSIFFAPLYIPLALILYSYWMTTILIRCVDGVLLDVALADSRFYESALGKKVLIITVVPWARKQLQIG